MKKIALLLLLLPTLIMVVSGVAKAQRKNTTSHDIVKKIESNINDPKKDIVSAKKEENCKCDCEYHKKYKKKHHKKQKNKSDK